MDPHPGGAQGRPHDALEREIAERDAARYAVADAEAREAVARRDVEGLRARLDELGDVDARFAAALDAKHAWATTHDPEGRVRSVRSPSAGGAGR